MIEKEVRAVWHRSPGLVAWPTGWQRPARTEEWVFECLSSQTGESPFSQLLCFPWASLIDLLDRKQFQRATQFIDALAEAPPRTHLIRATVCQHIRAESMLPWFKALQITDLFWSHARNDQLEIDGIRVHPFPLYPVRALERSDRLTDFSSPSLQRQFLYSFVGAYSPTGYLTPARQWIADLPPRNDAIVLIREMWHYEPEVYGEQIAQVATPPEVHARLAQQGEQYDQILSESLFSLCPSGSGPNSIRLWESLGFGCIPVLISDSLRLPGTPDEWNQAIVRVPETVDAIATLPARLEELRRNPAQLLRMQEAGRHLWLRYGCNGPVSILTALRSSSWVRGQITGSSARKI